MYYKILSDEQMVQLLKWQYGIGDKLAWQLVKSMNSVIKMDELMKKYDDRQEWSDEEC